MADTGKPQITVDGKRLNTAPNLLYRGQGMISANNSSRLLLDYRAENPEAYWEIMRLIFGEKGLGMSHLKVEMGADINSSSGTEPAVKRTADEPADATRGAAYRIAADALKINPALTLDMLWWGEPRWVTDAPNVYDARYLWHKETLAAAYAAYGIKFDYIGAVQNERASDPQWIKYLSRRLKEEKDCPYDYAGIKIVAGDEVCTWHLAGGMIEDKELRNAVDVVGTHYTSFADENAAQLAQKYGKELWLSEGSPAMSYSKGTCRFDEKRSGLTDIGGTLDVANRMIAMYPRGLMTLYEHQPVVAAYYDGAAYCSKQMIKAVEPWSGGYTLDSCFFMALHFSRFIKKGWSYVDGACFCDGEIGGDGHAMVNCTYSYMTVADAVSGDYSIVITNTTNENVTYRVQLKNMKKAEAPVFVWETRGPDGGEYDENYFKKIDAITPEETADGRGFFVTVKPYSLVTVSTLCVKEETYRHKEGAMLRLPYFDNYAYSEEFLFARGGAPKYTTDAGGAFEVVNDGGENVLMQVITADKKPEEWGWTPEPTTSFGDDRWFNYAVSADIRLEEGYAGVGLRYCLGGAGYSGYWAKLMKSGEVSLMKNGSELKKAALAGGVSALWNRVRVEAAGDRVQVFVNGESVIRYAAAGEAMAAAGRAALYSSYDRNCFRNFAAEPLKNMRYYVARYDDMDGVLSYEGDVHFITTGSWKNYNRTSSELASGASASFRFTGSGFSLLGENKAGVYLLVQIDGKTERFTTRQTEAREAFYYKHSLAGGAHTVRITVLAGKLAIDALEVVEEAN